METYQSVQLHCYDNVCHCDWRLTLYGCVESNAIRIINICNIVISVIISLIGVGVLFHHLVLKGQYLVDTTPKPGILRLNPINSLALILTVFSISRLICSVVLVTDIAADNMVFRAIFYEFGWQCGFWACTAYIVGMVHATVESQKSVSNKWLPSPRLVDITGFIFFLGPLFTISPLALAAGILTTSNGPAANLCVRIMYVFWVLLSGCLAMSVIYFGIRLIKALSFHLRKFNVTSKRLTEIKAGIFKIRCIIILMCLILFSFALFLLIYNILRDVIIKNYTLSVTLCTFFNLSGPIAILAGTSAYFFTPAFEKVALNGYETGQSSTVFDSQDGTKVISGMNKTFHDTLTHGALNNLEELHDEADGKWNTEGQPEQLEHNNNQHGHSEEPFEPAVHKNGRHDYPKETLKPTIHKNMSSYFGYSGERFEIDVHNNRYNYLEEPFEPDLYRHSDYRHSDEITATCVDDQGYEQFEMQNNNSRANLINKTY